MEYDAILVWEDDDTLCCIVVDEEVYGEDDVTEWDEDGWPVAFEDEFGDEYDIYDED